MKTFFSRLASDYGMAFVLLLLCVFFSIVTVKEQHPTGEEAGQRLASDLAERFGSSATILIVGSKGPEDVAFAKGAQAQLAAESLTPIRIVNGGPPEVRKALQEIVDGDAQLDAVACTKTAATWSLLAELGEKFPGLTDTIVVTPQSYLGSDFLKGENLANVASQSAIFAIIAVGMTMVIITAGIDLSVGSLVALAAVTAAILIRDWSGSFEATLVGMTVSCALAIVICGLAGLFTGGMVTLFDIPPFIATLAMMASARGMANIWAENQSVYEVPKSFSWFATGRPLGVANAVVIMIVLYIVAHILMTRTTLGRYIYAVGGNREAARLSGVPVRRVLLFVYTLCGALAGLGGVIEASRLSSGSPKYGVMYELYVIAAVVVGGTSLAGGEGKILNTLIGALIIAVIGNGMNLMNISSDPQDVVMGGLILAAVMIDMMKKRGWKLLPE